MVDYSGHSWWGLAATADSGWESYKIRSFSFSRKKTEPKESARAPLLPARRRIGRSARKLARLWRPQTVRALFADRPVDARRGTKGNSFDLTVNLVAAPLSSREVFYVSDKEPGLFFHLLTHYSEQLFSRGLPNRLPDIIDAQ